MTNQEITAIICDEFNQLLNEFFANVWVGREYTEKNKEEQK